MGPQVQFQPKTRCDWWGAEKRRFDPQTSLNRAYTPPTCSDGADYWRILQLAVWAFRTCVDLHTNFPPKFWYTRGSSNTAIWPSNVTVSSIYSSHGLRWRCSLAHLAACSLGFPSMRAHGNFPPQTTNVFIHIYTCVRIVSIEISNLTHSVRTMCSGGVLMDNILHIQYNVYKTMFTNSC